MPVSRHSFRRVIGDLVNRHNIKNDYQKTTNRSNKKIDRNSLVHTDSLSVC